jgi:hypothetical protein
LKERQPTEHDATDDAVVMADSSWVDDVSILMTQDAAMPTRPDRVVSGGDVTCEALQLALTALHIDMAWHAGVMSAEASMEALDREVGRTTSRYNLPTRANATEVVSRAPSHMTATARAAAFGGKTEYEPGSHVFPTA